MRANDGSSNALNQERGGELQEDFESKSKRVDHKNTHNESNEKTFYRRHISSSLKEWIQKKQIELNFQRWKDFVVLSFHEKIA